MTIAEELQQQGLEQGIQQGEGALLVKLLLAKFGHIEPHVLHRLQTADRAAIDGYAERLLTAATLETCSRAERSARRQAALPSAFPISSSTRV